MKGLKPFEKWILLAAAIVLVGVVILRVVGQ